jgi:hypothetical protein
MSLPLLVIEKTRMENNGHGEWKVLKGGKRFASDPGTSFTRMFPSVL